MTTTTTLTTIDFHALAGVTGGCHKGQPPVINNNNNVVQAPPAQPAPPPQIIEAPRKPVSVAVDYQG